MKADEIRSLIAYHHDTYDRVWDSVARLTPEQFLEPVNYSIGSIRDHLMHVAATDQRWIARLNGDDPLPARLVWETYATIPAARTKWDDIRDYVRAHGDRLTDAGMDDVLTYDFPHRGGLKQMLRWQVYVHLVNHGTDHRAQLLALLHRHGGATFEQDYMLYLWDKAL